MTSERERSAGQAGFETKAIHGPGDERPYPYRAVTPPIVHSSTFRFEDIEAMRTEMDDARAGIFYSRRHNPTSLDAEQRLAMLEGCDSGALFACGMAAITTTVLSPPSRRWSTGFSAR